MKGTSEEGTERGMDGARERGEGGSERRMPGLSEEGREHVSKGEGNFAGGSIFTNQPFTNRPLPFETLVLQ